MKHLLTTFGCLALIVAMVCACGNRKNRQAEESEDENMTTEVKTGWDNLPAEPVFDIITTMGTMRVKLYADTPKHRDNFVKLVKEGYYDGILFHRVINEFMIQTGDPLSRDASKMDEWGSGGPDYTIQAEILPQYYHKKGALAAARRGNAANPMKASSGSQFYIVQDEFNCLHLDGEYSIFGETIDGLDVIDQIAGVPTDNMDRPLINVKILKIELVDESELEAEESDTETEVADGDVGNVEKNL